MKKILTLSFLLFTLIPLYSQIENDDVGTNSAVQSTSFNFCPPEDESACNLEIYNGLYDWVSNNSYSGGQLISNEDNIEGTIGAITIANKNDTDGDDNIDNIDSNGVIDGDLGRNEIDLMQLVIKKPDPVIIGESAILTIVSGGNNIKLWSNPNKTEEIIVTGGNISFQTSELDKVIFIEVIQESSSAGDIEFKLEYNGNEDIVKATGIWFIEHVFWVTRVDAVDPMDNPDPITDLLNLGNTMSDLETLFINGNISWEGSRYGHGNYRKESVTPPMLPMADIKIGGRILYEFEIFPHLTDDEISDFNLVFDITRQRRTRLRTIESGSGELKLPNSSQRDFPWEAGADNETPNDDDKNEDEDNTLQGNFIYTYDAPGITLDDPFQNFAAFNISKTSFFEFVRVKIDENFTNMNGLVEGSRASDRSAWHSFLYVKRGSNGLLVEDDAIVSLSEPVENTSGLDKGNFELSIVSGGAASVLTSGYKVVFDGDDNKWVLTNNTSLETFASDEVSPSEGAVWTINTGSIQVKVTQTGGINFMTGELITFSSFRTSAMMGKVNDTNIGELIVDEIF